MNEEMKSQKEEFLVKYYDSLKELEYYNENTFFWLQSIGEGIDVMMYLEIPTVFPACFSFLNYKIDLLPSVY